MDPTQIYALCIGAVGFLLIAHRLSCCLHIYSLPFRAVTYLRFPWPSIQLFLFKHFAYPFLYRRPRVLASMTRLGAILRVAYWALTATCNLYKAGTLAEVGGRSASLAVITLVPLLLTGRLSLVADLLGISLRSYVRIHGTMGIMACVQALIHILISIKVRGFSLDNFQHLYGLLVWSYFCQYASFLVLTLLGSGLSWSDSSPPPDPQVDLRCLHEDPLRPCNICYGGAVAACQF